MSIQRREFLKTASLLTSGLMLSGVSSQLVGCASSKVNAAVNNNFGLQLYTLRDVLPNDPKDVLKQVGSFGYKQLEGYEGPKGIYWGMKNTEFKKYIGDLGMNMVSSHCNWTTNLEQKAAEAAEIGMKWLMCPFLGLKPDIDFYKQTAEKFNQAGEVCKKAGIRFAYHNHDYSFKQVEGQLPQDVMMQNTDPSLVDFEMDIYWVVAAGADPVAWFNKHPNRFKLVHVKDRKGSESVVLGTGTIDFPTILKEGHKKGVEYFIVEQEAYTGTTPLNAAKADADYMKNFKA
jgi:sugar phosphate isomerase/epimerase